MYHSLALVNNVKLVLQRVYLASPPFNTMQQGFQDITSNPLKGAIWCCKIHEHLWSEIGEDKGEKRVSITKILADILSEIFYARPPLPPVSRLVNCNIWSEREKISTIQPCLPVIQLFLLLLLKNDSFKWQFLFGICSLEKVLIQGSFKECMRQCGSNLRISFFLQNFPTSETPQLTFSGPSERRPIHFSPTRRLSGSFGSNT